MKIQSDQRRWQVLATVAQSIGARSVIEVGCKEGKTAAFLLEHCPGLRVTTVDPWRPFAEHAGRIGGETYEEWDFAAIEADYNRRTEKHKDRLEHLRMTSLEAADKVHAEILAGKRLRPDLVFIDAAHDYENAKADIEAWRRVMKPGGYLCGHDYQHDFPGVMRAVADTIPLMFVAVMPDSVWMHRLPE